MNSVFRSDWKRAAVAVLAFGVAFGYVEAAVVSYLRVIYEPVRQQYHPGRAPGELFPLLTIEQRRSAGPEQARVAGIEVGREAATILMLAAVALAAARGIGPWAAAFAMAFGAWDITFYVCLKLLLDWPRSLLTWDVLFLIPAPWAGPVLAPVIVSVSMIAAGVLYLWREAGGEPVRMRAPHWLGVALGACVIVVSFTWDSQNIMAGGMPQPFPWAVFGAGEAIGLISFLIAVRYS